MGEKREFQPLTGADRLSVFLYRTGILLTGLLLAAGAWFYFSQGDVEDWEVLAERARPWGGIYVLLLFISAGITSFTIHLYVKKFRILIKRLYLLSVVFLVAGILYKGAGDLGWLFFSPWGIPSLLPLSLCIGFVAAKEAFCFRMVEGYIIAMFLPFTVLVIMLRLVAPAVGGVMIYLITFLYLLFMVRKIPMPFAFDIGDKSAYEQ